MKVYQKEINTGRINVVDYHLTAHNSVVVTKRDYEKQRANIYLRAKRNIGLS
jgi:hypothetical protein